MKISYRWLQQYLELPADMTPYRLGEMLTNKGIPVEVIEPRNLGVSGVVVGHVLETIQHPDADRLRVCTIDAGTGEHLQIVCGAPNVRPGQKVPAALVGAELPGDMKIKKAKLRGVESQGMLCSAKELGLDTKLLPKDQTEGLYILPENETAGIDIVDVLGLDDFIMDLELTPNRSDCLSYRGVAYEVGAILGIEPIFTPTESISKSASSTAKNEYISVQIESENCTHYTAQVIRGVKVQPSPLWLQMRLLAVGVRPINNIVDVTNYVMFEYGQPLHAFDASEIRQSKIDVRQARDGESLVTLDSEERILDDSMLVIADPERVIGLAGVMGGENSEVHDQTTDIILESAYFDPGVTRKTGKMLGLRSEAQIRFEKGIDPSMGPAAVVRAAQLIVEISGGEIVGAPVEVHLEPSQALPIDLRLDRIGNVLGLQLDQDRVVEIIERLAFGVENKGNSVLTVLVPPRRPDITREIDLIEEVARMHGYDQIPTTLPDGIMTEGSLSIHHRLRRQVRDLLMGMGLTEVLTYTLTNPSWLEPIGLASDAPERIQPSLVYPLSDERKNLRTMLLPSLTEVVQHNVNRKNMNLSLFEIGKVFRTEKLPLNELPQEHMKVAAIFTGIFGGQGIGEQKEKVDFFTVKGVLESLLLALGVPEVRFQAETIPGMHPGRCAKVIRNGIDLGYIGALHPELQASWDIPETYYLELDLSSIEKVTTPKIEYRALPKYPAIERDLAMVLPIDVPAGTIREVILATAGELAKDVRLFDIYQGSQVPDGMKSLAFAIVYQAEDRTLTDDEVAGYQDRVIQAISQYDAKLRS